MKEIFKKILANVIGFRSGKLKNKICASCYYIIAFWVAFDSGKAFLPSLITYFSLPFAVFSFKEFKKNLKSKLTALISLVLIIIATISMPVPQLEEIDFLEEKIIFEDIKQTQTIDYVVSPQDADTSKIKLVCDNEKIAKFNGDELTALSVGETTIYAVVEGTKIVSEKLNVKVLDKQAELQKQANEISKKINKLKKVTLDSKQDIAVAEKAYNEASDEVKKLLENDDVLKNAKNEYKKLELQEKESQEKEEQKKEAAEKTSEKQQPVEKESKQQKTPEKTAGQQQAVEEKPVQQQPVESKPKQQSVETPTQQQPVKNETAEQSVAQNQVQQSNQQSAPQVSNIQSTSDSDSIVYIGKTGTKFHMRECPTLKGKGTPISLSEAKAAERQACQVCGG